MSAELTVHAPHNSNLMSTPAHVAVMVSICRYGEAGHLQAEQGSAQLLSQLLPGPVTVLLTRRPDAPLCSALNPGVATIGGTCCSL